MQANFSSPYHRAQLALSSAYVAGPLFSVGNLHWKHLGKQNVLKEGKAAPANPDGPEAQDAVLVVVGNVANNNIALSPVGAWKSSYNKSLASAKYQFQILQPDTDAIFGADFLAAVATLKNVQKSIARDGQSKWLLMEDATSGTTIRFSWHVFEVIGPSTDTESLPILDWPIANYDRDALIEISQTHAVTPFTVFDPEHNRIPPERVHPRVKVGALVECHFSLVHYVINGVHQFNAECKQLTILRDPQPKPSSPYKWSSATPYKPPSDLHKRQIEAAKAFVPKAEDVTNSTPHVPSNPVAGPSNLAASDGGKRKLVDDSPDEDVREEKRAKTSSDTTLSSIEHANITNDAETDPGTKKDAAEENEVINEVEREL
ncbi:hypothetical protein GGX14DRAFT_577135 [Mycena pura]|uniref:Uncharacterized protein n=1 Tax=Mycena pura TaxID=153505 RepID=A0AAD6XZ69_9AGAR|nr:hypothetical protein GGX14DRAFT_577135 [Mycena pura]